MKLKAFYKALSFALLPTASLLLLLLFAFCSVTDTFQFIFSSHGLAIALRIIAFIAEVIVVWYFYEKNLNELTRLSVFEDSISTKISKKQAVYRHDEVYQLFGHSRTNDFNYYKLETENKDIIILEVEKIK